jgi:hypothetical protein
MDQGRTAAQRAIENSHDACCAPSRLGVLETGAWGDEQARTAGAADAGPGPPSELWRTQASYRILYSDVVYFLFALWAIGPVTRGWWARILRAPLGSAPTCDPNSSNLLFLPASWPTVFQFSLTHLYVFLIPLFYNALFRTSGPQSSFIPLKIWTSGHPSPDPARDPDRAPFTPTVSSGSDEP